MRKSKQARQAKRASKALAASNQAAQEAHAAVLYERTMQQALSDTWVQFMADIWVMHLTDEDEMDGKPWTREEVERHIDDVMKLYDEFVPVLTAHGDDAIYIRSKMDERIMRGMNYKPEDFVKFETRYPHTRDYFVTPQKPARYSEVK